MPEFQYGYAADGSLVDVFELTPETRPRLGPFQCVACGRPLVARLGKVRTPHFAHKPEGNQSGRLCSFETYLHSTAKRAFYETFLHCREQQKPFRVEVRHPLRCKRPLPPPGQMASLRTPLSPPFFVTGEGERIELCQNRTSLVRHDLAALYDAAYLERRDDTFVPDLLLTDSTGQHPKLYIEIYVTHAVTTKKAGSGIAIIEITVKTEQFIRDHIRGASIPEKAAKFFNQASLPVAMPQLACDCCPRIAHEAAPPPVEIRVPEMRSNVSSRVLCRDGIFFQTTGDGTARLRAGMMQDFEIEWRQQPRSDSSYRCYSATVDLPRTGPWQMPLTIVSDLQKRGRAIPRHCFLCRHARMSWMHSQHSQCLATTSAKSAISATSPYAISVLCSIYKHPCKDHHAPRCDRFRAIEVPGPKPLELPGLEL